MDDLGRELQHQRPEPAPTICPHQGGRRRASTIRRRDRGVEGTKRVIAGDSARVWRTIGVALLCALAACSGSDDKVAETSTPPPPGNKPGGVIDKGFGTGGAAVHGASSSDTINAVLGTKTDATLAIGSSLSGDKTSFLLMRVRGDGSLDPSFGNGGRTVTPIGQGSADALAAGYAQDGKILVAGSAGGADGADPDVAVARYLPDGSLDTAFGRGGVALNKVSSGPDTAFALATDRDGRIVVAGQCGRANLRENTRGTACVARFAANGDVDAAFGPNGARLLPLRDGVESLRGVAVDPRGRIVATGYSAYSAANELTLFRLSAAGDLDSDFGDLGSATYRGRGFADAFALSLVNDAILVAGFSGRADGSGKDFLLARFAGDGRLDRKFGDGGATMTPIGDGDDVAFALSTSDRGIVIAGYAFNGTENDMAVARYSTDGKLDESFGNRGSLTIQRGAMAVARGLVLRDSTITLAGEVKSGEGRSAILARVVLP